MSDHKAPDTHVYLRMMRLTQPAGIWLLMWPCWWAVALASAGFPSLLTLFLFFLGAFLMRPAGCVINDIVDRKLDARVARTQNRPLANGKMMVGEAVRLALWLMLLALGVAFALGEKVVWWSLAALPLVLLYPWMKRITWWPQLFLGLTFNWGALVGWVAVTGAVELPAVLLYIGGVFWTLGYDTIYAHQDKAYDIEAGMKSSAIRLGSYTKPALFIFYTLATLFWAAAGHAAGAQLAYFIIVGFVWLHFIGQTMSIRLGAPATCHRAFISNAGLGFLLFAGCLLAFFNS